MAVRKATGAVNGVREAVGAAVLLVALLLLLSLFSYDPDDVAALTFPPNARPNNLAGLVGAWVAFGLFTTLGAAAYLVAAGALTWSVALVVQRIGSPGRRGLWILVMAAATAVLFGLHPETAAGWAERHNALGGGVLGEWLGRRVLGRFFGDAGALVIAVGLATMAVAFFFSFSPFRAAQWMVRTACSAYGRWQEARLRRMDRVAQLDRAAREVAQRRRTLEDALKRHREIPDREGGAPVRSGVSEPALARATGRPVAPPTPVRPPLPPAVESVVPAASPSTPSPASAAPSRPPPAPKSVCAAPEPVAPCAPPPSAAAPRPVAVADHVVRWTLPGLEILEPLPSFEQRAIAEDLQKTRQTLVETLSDFGIEVQVTGVQTGPVVTRYELLPAPGVRVEKITGLSNNIALALKAENVRVLAPIPGKGVVGIEVPNARSAVVYLREVLESEAWRTTRAALPLAIGKDVAGRVMVADLADMPHLLIAGATGSGKTVCMNALLCGLLMCRSPEQLRLLLVDPKIVEFASYRDLPHLVVPVITDSKKVPHGLRWAIQEMEARYKLFAKAGVRNIRDFNARPISRQPDLFGGEVELPAQKIPDRVPYIVVVVDELSDLMLTAQAEIENQIARLAQMSRAVGIHMILATQRPSVDVITGTIKANIPARIAFQVAQKNDSRTILDANGADKLLGRGDMLFLPPGVARLVRAQGCMVTDADVRAIADHWRRQGPPSYDAAIVEKLERKSAELPENEEDERLAEQAIQIFRETRRASTSVLQRRLRIGYTRASRVMDLLEERGIVGPARGSDPREILVDLDGEIPSNPGAAAPRDGEGEGQGEEENEET